MAMREQSCTQPALWGLVMGFKEGGGEVMNPNDLCQGSGSKTRPGSKTPAPASDVPLTCPLVGVEAPVAQRVSPYSVSLHCQHFVGIKVLLHG